MPKERGQGRAIGVDFIGKYERLNQDFSLLKRILGITNNSELPVLRREYHGLGKKINNVDNYLKFIRNTYSRDLQLLNYTV